VGRASVSPAASPSEKDVETMPAQKIFKRRVRARMSKTGESYTAARRQLLRKSGEPDAAPGDRTPAPEPAPVTPSAPVTPAAPDLLMTSEESMRRGSGKGHEEWFALLDAWGATGHTHTEIASWLRETHGVPGWWTQNITVNYERARGMRAPGQMRNGYTVSVTRTVRTDGERALAAFTDETIRRRWLTDGEMRRRPTKAALVARFDWSDPPSRVVVAIVPKPAGKVVVAVAHEQLPDADSAEAQKTAWRVRLDAVRALLEAA
jgi:hypothetical protein